jgi:hypothetical protein
MRRPPKSYFRETKIGFTDEDREAFRWRMDALLNGVLRIQRLAEREETHEVILRNRIDLCRQAARLIADACGDWVKLSENDANSPLEYVSLSLEVWQPVLAMHDEYDFFWDDVIDEIVRLPFGDEPEIFKPAPRQRGEHSQPARLTLRRLTALQWADFLRSRGIRPNQFKMQISLAYGADWDAIRKWKSAAESKFGLEFVSRRLAWAREGYGLDFAFPDYLANLHAYGEDFREVAGLRSIDLSAYQASLQGRETG